MHGAESCSSAYFEPRGAERECEQFARGSECGCGYFYSLIAVDAGGRGTGNGSSNRGRREQYRALVIARARPVPEGTGAVRKGLEEDLDHRSVACCFSSVGSDAYAHPDPHARAEVLPEERLGMKYDRITDGGESVSEKRRVNVKVMKWSAPDE